MKLSYNNAEANLAIDKALSLEWLETNGLGGYSSSTIINCHTRKYHGLLVSTLDNMPDKYVLLSKIEDSFACDGGEHYLSAHQYPDYLADGSFSDFQEFVLDTHPVFRYKFGDVDLEKQILLLDGEDTLLIKYKTKPGIKADVSVRPLLAFRNFHALVRENSNTKPSTASFRSGLQFSIYDGMPCLFLQTEGDFAFSEQNVWYKNFIYAREQERGYDFIEDLFTPGAVSLAFPTSGEIIIAFSIKKPGSDLSKMWEKEIDRRVVLEKNLSGSPLQKQLKKVARSFIVKRKTGVASAVQSSGKNANLAVIAGYHWFLEWGRDAMISLPGLTLYSGLEKECFLILREFAAHEKGGLIPNFLGVDAKHDAFNSVDASLWFVWAVQQYYLKTKDIKSIAKHLWQTIKNIFNNYKIGTLHDIKMRENGLLYAGSADVNLTWMDAMINNKPVTPRYGFQVEINALWYNMLCFAKMLAGMLFDSIGAEIAALLPKIKSSFAEIFWSEDLGYLYDFVNAEQKSAAIRPNQMFAVSLPHPVIGKDMALKVMSVVQEHLLTPYGLRTLSPSDPSYCANYFGAQEARDNAYHNGTVWPWLLCHFAEGLLATNRDKKSLNLLLQPCLDALQSRMADDAGVGTISEIFSAEMPHQSNGCISQAWSVAEILRLTYLLSVR